MAHRSLLASTDLGVLPEWDLSDLYPGPESMAFRTDMAMADQKAREFAALYRGRLKTLAEQAHASAALAQAIQAYEQLQDLIGRLASYAGLLYAGDATDPERIKFKGDVQAQITELSAHTLFFTLELNQLSAEALGRAWSHPPLARWRPWLEDLRKEKPHELDEPLERLLHDKALTSSLAFNRLFDETMAAMRCSVNGEALTLEATLSLLTEPRERVRKTAADALAEALQAKISIFTLITNTLSKDKEICDRWRSFKDVADSRHLNNRVEGEVVDALAAAVRAGYPRLTHRYYRLKAQWFGKEALDHWDRNAPLPDCASKIYSWDQAKQTVLGAYGRFSPDMAAIAQRFFDGRWIDAPARPGKAPGAFAHPVTPSVHPYILLNYMGRPRDVMTLAHELGHGVHQVLAGPQGALMSQTPLTLAETASVFGEMLTFRSLLDQTEDPQARKALIASKVEDMLNTVVRQIAFYTFEREVHLQRRNGELTSEQIGRLWMRTQTESLGPSVRLGAGYETFWAYIPHFIHAPFYVYAYAFGDCLVNSLYGLYRSQPAGFVERYFELLKAGGSKPYAELLAPFGLDLSEPTFWSFGLKTIEDLIQELETLEALET